MKAGGLGFAVFLIILMSSAWSDAQLGPGFGGRPVGPGFGGTAVGPGFSGTAVGPGFSPNRASRIGFDGIPRGPGFQPNLSDPVGFQGQTDQFPVVDRGDPVQFRSFGSGF